MWASSEADRPDRNPRLRRGRTQPVHHDRIHAREPTHDREAWRVGTVRAVSERDGHWVVTVEPADGERVDLTTTLAIRDLVRSRLPEPDASPVGQQVWFQNKGE
jgi:hypothetical protein